MKRLILIMLVLSAVSGAVLVPALFINKDRGPERISVLETLSDAPSPGYQRALEPVEISFPRDMGPHPGFQTEWWYYTGNLTDDEGRRFGYQLTFFRRSLSPDADKTESAWRTNRIYFAYFALTDVNGNSFYPAERWSRDSLGLAGAEASPYRVWLGDWQVSGSEGGYRLSAGAGGVSFDLVLKPLKPPALHGEQGLSRKGRRPGDASYYYSLTRLETTGTISLGGRDYGVSGLSWFDHEWSTGALGPEQAGWDWFSLQLDDGREIMLYRLRLKGGGMDRYSSGSLIMPGGSVVHLSYSDFEIEVLDTWVSPGTGARYPARWRISLPSYGIEMTVEPYVSSQEHAGSFVYWEGAVKASGASVSGSGYVELTGYGE